MTKEQAVQVLSSYKDQIAGGASRAEFQTALDTLVALEPAQEPDGTPTREEIFEMFDKVLRIEARNAWTGINKHSQAERLAVWKEFNALRRLCWMLNPPSKL